MAMLPRDDECGVSDTKSVALDGEAVNGVDVGIYVVEVLLESGSDEHTCVGANQGGDVESGVVKGLVSDLQSEPLLGVQDGGLERGDLEELAVEPVDVLEEAASVCHRFSSLLDAFAPI